jgi:hypothetical protein
LRPATIVAGAQRRKNPAVASQAWRYVSLALRANGDGMTVLAFAPYGMHRDLLARHGEQRLGGNIAEHVGDLPGHAHRRMAEGDDRRFDNV